ncbi:MAG: hypothetical protein ABJH82_12945 [Polaribacter sp.]|uniref:hypothetical protein n=1 Tax=Polaribacter sp. TaxID=1920175 RepID=UPI003265B320
MKFYTKNLFYFLSFLLVFSSCNQKQDDEKINVEKLKNATITYKRAAQLQKEYIDTRATILNKHLNSINHFKQKQTLVKEDKFIEDVRDVTFDLNTLKQYIAYVEKEANKKGLKGLGLRVYLGAYSTNDNDPRVKTPGFSTVFFLPTHQPNEEESNAKNFYFWHHDKVIDGIDGLNFGSGTPPPNNLNN